MRLLDTSPTNGHGSEQTPEIVEEQGSLMCAVHEVAESDAIQQLNNNNKAVFKCNKTVEVL